MKCYYGNTWKEAMSNPPIEIESAEQLQQYEECYTFVITKIEKEEDVNG